jgi:hypothetical protein
MPFVVAIMPDVFVANQFQIANQCRVLPGSALEADFSALFAGVDA